MNQQGQIPRIGIKYPFVVVIVVMIIVVVVVKDLAVDSWLEVIVVEVPVVIVVAISSYRGVTD